MKKILVLMSVLFSSSILAGTFKAVVLEDRNVLAINVNDSDFPPFEGGALWKSMKGEDRRKLIEANDFFMECDGFFENNGEAIGDCTLMISMDAFQKMGGKLVYKLTGAKAAQLNRYFKDSAYVSLQRGKAHLSSYNTRRQFFFGIDEDLITK